MGVVKKLTDADGGLGSLFRPDLVDADLIEKPNPVKIETETLFYEIVNGSTDVRGRTPFQAKTIIETADLVKTAIGDYEKRANTNEDGKLKSILWGHPDTEAQLEAISFKLVKRSPGLFSQGSPDDMGKPGKVKNRVPILRELIDDVENPGYQTAVLGYFYDNILRMTAWARTNKSANQRALWLEQVMEEYGWFFQRSGVLKLLWHGQGEDEVITSTDRLSMVGPLTIS